jgi:hypothetical protein
MLKELFELLDPDPRVKLVVKVPGSDMYLRFIKITNAIKSVHSAVLNGEGASYVVVIELRSRYYLTFMQTLQKNGLNLKMCDKYGLCDELIQWTK